MRRMILAAAFAAVLACAGTDEVDPCHAECNVQKPSSMTGVTCGTCTGGSTCQCYDPEWWTDNGEDVPPPGHLCRGTLYLGGCGPAPWEVPGVR